MVLPRFIVTARAVRSLAAVLITGWTFDAGAVSLVAQVSGHNEAIRRSVRQVAREQVEREALRATDRYLEAWNSRNPTAWAHTLHFPHVRPGVGSFRVINTAKDYGRGVNFERTLSTGWHRSQWNSYDVFQVGPTKAHVAGHYSRYDSAGEQIRTAFVTYVVTKQGTRWGIQSRFAAGGADVSELRRFALATTAVAAVEAFFAAFNDPTDAAGWAATLNYPHVRLADRKVEVWKTAEAYLTGLQPGRQRTWVRTRLDWAEPVQVGRGGVNVAVRFSRLNRQGDTLSSYEAVYLVTTRDGHVGIQARSSFAP